MPSTSAHLDLERLGKGVAQAGGWNPILAARRCGRTSFLFGPAHSLGPGSASSSRRLIGAPIAATLVAAAALPVHVDALVLCAPGVALAVGAVAIPLSPIRGLVAAGVAVLLFASAITIAVRQTADVDEDWRALAAAVKRVKGPKETVVVLPEAHAQRSRTTPRPRDDPVRPRRGRLDRRQGGRNEAIDASRPVVPTPRYALLRQFRYGNDLRLQHWVRP